MNSIASTWKARLSLWLFVSLSLIALDLRAQIRVDQYIQEAATTSFQYAFNTYLGYSDDAIRNISMPFAFTYDGTTYASGTKLYISHNGWIKFGSSSSGYNTVGSSSYPGHICVFAADQTSSLYYGVSGSSPNRVLTIMYYSLAPYLGSTYQYINVKLFETSNAIEFNYLYKNNYHSRASGIGLNGNTAGGFRTKVYNYGTYYTPGQDIRYRPPVADKPQLTITGETDINFGEHGLGSSQTACITVTNTGTPGEAGAPANPLTFTPTSISGSSEYSLGTQPTTLNIGESAEYCVTFAPLNPGVHNGWFEIKTNAEEDGTKIVNVTGIGLAPIMAIDQPYLFRKTYTKAGYELEKGFAIENKGNAPLTITSIEITGDYADQYHVTRQPEAPIGSGAVDSVYVVYSPIYEGLKSAEMTIKSDGFASSEYKINLWGTGIIPRLTVTPDRTGIDSVMMGDTAYYTVELKNVGSDTVAIYQDYFASADPDFFYQGLVGADSLITPEHSRQVVIGFAPQTRGTRQARVRLLTNLPKTFEAIPRDTSEFNVNITAVGVPTGLLYVEGPSTIDSSILGTQLCKDVTIWNNGQSPLTITAASLIGPAASDFALNGVTLPLTIDPQTNVTAQICGTPSERGLRSAMIDITAISGEQSTNTQLPVAIYGLQVCAQSSTNAAFENELVHVGESSTAQIMVNNCGDVATAYTAALTGNGYTLTSAATTPMIAPGENATFDIAFNPTVMGAMPGTLTISGQGITDIPVQLTGVGGDVMIEASNTTAPETGVSLTSPEFTVTVKNAGNMDLTPGDPAVTGTEFAYVAGSGPALIAAGAEGTYRFTFTPSEPGNRTATVNFPSASPALASTFSLSGNGISAAVRPVAQNGFVLEQNYPNPFRPSTSIAFTMAEAGRAQIVITDVTGKIVASIADGNFSKGHNEVAFDASNLASGTYFYELVTHGIHLQRAMLVRK